MRSTLQPILSHLPASFRRLRVHRLRGSPPEPVSPEQHSVGILRRGLLRCAAAALVATRPALRTSVGVPFALLARASRNPSARSSPATIVWPPSPSLRAYLSCLVGLTEPVRSAWRVTEHAFLLAPPGSSCSISALRPSSNPLIRLRSHSCVSDVSHSSESQPQGQGDNAKSTGYPQEFD